MGYYSIIKFDGFKTDFAQGEFEGHMKSFVEGRNSLQKAYGLGNVVNLDMYRFDVKDGYAFFSMPGEDYLAKHSNDQELAEFVSEVIRPFTRTYMEFIGESGERWGYAIESGRIRSLEYHDPTVNGVPLSRWLDNEAYEPIQKEGSGFCIRKTGRTWFSKAPDGWPILCIPIEVSFNGQVLPARVLMDHKLEGPIFQVERGETRLDPEGLFPDSEDPWALYERLEQVAADLVADIWDHLEECLP